LKPGALATRHILRQDAGQLVPDGCNSARTRCSSLAGDGRSVRLPELARPVIPRLDARPTPIRGTSTPPARIPMTWQPDIDELNRRAAMSRQMGGADSVAFHKSRGKLTVRERLDLLADTATFRETGVLAGRPEWRGNELVRLTPANSVTGV